MKLYKYIIMLLLVLAVPANSEAQILRGLFKNAGKKGAEKVMAKKAGKEVVKKTTKELSEEMAEKTAKTWAKSNIKKGEVKLLESASSKAARQEFMEKGAKDAMSGSIAKISQEAVESAAKKGIKVGVAKEGRDLMLEKTGKVASAEYYKAIKNEVVELSEKNATASLNKGHKALVEKNEARRLAIKTGTKTAVDRVESLLGKEASRLWKEIAQDAGESASRQLIEDVSKNGALRKLFQRNPELLKAYIRLVESPLRTDIALLRYLNHGAGKYGRWYKQFAKKWGVGEDIIIRSEKGVNKIYNTAGDLLGTITGDSRMGYIIECSEVNRTLLNIFPLGNTTYKCGSNLWRTDRFGRVVYAKASLTGRPAKVIGRDNKIQRDVVGLKNSLTTNGDPAKATKQFVNDEGGHIIALNHGGTNDLINFVPQHSRINRGEGAFSAMERAWFRSEKSMTQALNKGQHTEREIFLNYANNITMRPSSFGITQTINGKIDILAADKYGSAVSLDKFLINHPD